jgi:SAM-dependent methyltransferase
MEPNHSGLYQALSEIDKRPAAWSAYTANVLWDDDHISARMLEYHLDELSAPASRPHEFIDQSAAWIADRFGLGPGKQVADFGCGPGLYASRFAATGATVTGIDFSRNSLAYARDRAAQSGHPIEYVHTNYLTWDPTKRFDLITLIYCDFCALSPAQRAGLLRTFGNALTENGMILLDIFSLAAFAGREESTEYGFRLHDGFWARSDYRGFRNTFTYDDEKVVLDKYVIVEPDRVWEVYNWLQYFCLDSLRSEFEQAGLQIVDHHGDVGGAPYAEAAEVFAVVARKA